MPEILSAGEIGRLAALSGNAATNDKIPIYDTSLGQLRYATPDQIASGASAVDGPASATDNAIARFDGITGKIIQNSAATVADTTGAISIAGTTNQLVLGTTNTTTISAVAPSASRVISIQDPGAAANIMLSEGTQTNNAVNTYGAINRKKATNAITAFATGGQASAVALVSEINSITVCATDGDSVKLPTSVAGMDIQVANLGAAYANVFPISGDLIDGLAANTAVSLPVGATLRFTCAVAGSWKSVVLAQPGAKFTTGTTTTTFAAGQLTGAAFVVYNNTQGTPGSIATRTAAQMFTDNPYARVGGTYHLRIINNQGTGTLTVTLGTNVTLTGTMTIAANTFRDFVVTYTSATALVIQQVGIGTDA